MTREQMERDAEVLMYLSTRVKTGPEANAVERALNNLRARLARMDGPPPGHVRVAFSMFVGREGSYSTTERRVGDRHCVINVDLPLPEPAAEVEGEVE